MIDFEMLVDEIRIKARAAILDGCNLDLEPSQFSDCMEYLIDRLRQAEKDAARYRWIKANGQLGVGRCGVDWELHFEGPAPDNSAKVERHIDETMQCNK